MMNVNFGLMPPLGKVRGGKKVKKQLHAEKALAMLDQMIDDLRR